MVVPILSTDTHLPDESVAPVRTNVDLPEPWGPVTRIFGMCTVMPPGLVTLKSVSLSGGLAQSHAHGLK